MVALGLLDVCSDAGYFPPATTVNRYDSLPAALVDPLPSSTTEDWLVVRLRGVTTAFATAGGELGVAKKA